MLQHHFLSLHRFYVAFYMQKFLTSFQQYLIYNPLWRHRSSIWKIYQMGDIHLIWRQKCDKTKYPPMSIKCTYQVWKKKNLYWHTPSSSSKISLPMAAKVVHLQFDWAFTAHLLWALNLHTTKLKQKSAFGLNSIDFKSQPSSFSINFHWWPLNVLIVYFNYKKILKNSQKFSPQICN